MHSEGLFRARSSCKVQPESSYCLILLMTVEVGVSKNCVKEEKRERVNPFFSDLGDALNVTHVVSAEGS